MSIDDPRKKFLADIQHALVSSKALGRVEHYFQHSIKVNGQYYDVLPGVPPSTCDYCGAHISSDPIRSLVLLARVQRQDNPADKYYFCRSCLGGSKLSYDTKQPIKKQPVQESKNIQAEALTHLQHLKSSKDQSKQSDKKETVF